MSRSCRAFSNAFCSDASRLCFFLFHVCVALTASGGPLDALFKADVERHLLVPPNGGVGNTETTCSVLMIQTLLASVVCREVAHSEVAAVQLCHRNDTLGEAAGHLVLTSPNGNANSSINEQRIYRIRVVGPEVLLLDIQYCPDAIAMAQYNLPVGGSWHFEVLLLYDNYTLPPPDKIRSDIRAAKFGLTIPTAAALPKKCTHGTCRYCNSHSSPGRWVVHNSSAAETLRQTCLGAKGLAAGCESQLSDLAFQDVGSLTWQPYSCRYRRFHRSGELQYCLSALRKPVCLQGDSQTRHLYNIMVYLLERQDTARLHNMAQSKLDAILKDNVHVVLPSQKFVYVFDAYGARLNQSQCSHVFVNFGQWPISYTTWKHADKHCERRPTMPEGCPVTSKSPRQPWSVQQYADKVELMAKHMVQQQQQHGNKHYWSSTNTLPIHEDFHIKEGGDWRVDPTLIIYNKVATTIMQQYGIPVVDTFSISSPLQDLSYDDSHYVGHVGWAQARMLLHVLCHNGTE